MRNTPYIFSIEELIEKAERMQPKNRLFRIYAYSPTLFDLLLLLEKQLSGGKDLERITPDHRTWDCVLRNIQSLYKSGDHENDPNVLYYIGQIALLLESIESRDAHINIPNLVRAFA